MAPPELPSQANHPLNLTAAARPAEPPNQMQLQSSKGNCGAHSSPAIPAPAPHPLPPTNLTVDPAFLVSSEAEGSHVVQRG